MPPTSWIFGFWVSTHLRFFNQKRVFGVRDYHQWIRIEIWSHIQVSMPQIEFSEAILNQIPCFPAFLFKVDFFDHPRFGVHKFLQMWGLHGLPSTPMDAPWKVSMEEHSFSPRSRIWDQNLPKNIFRPGPKAIFKLVRPTAIFHLRPFSSWTDRSLKSSQMFLKPSWNFLKCP